MEWNKTNVAGNVELEYERYKIFDYEAISPKAKDKIPDKTTIGTGEYDTGNWYRVYPFKCMRIGQAFYVLASEQVLRYTLESCHRAFSKSHPGRYFRVIWHKSHQCYEVVRIK